MPKSPETPRRSPQEPEPPNPGQNLPDIPRYENISSLTTAMGKTVGYKRSDRSIRSLYQHFTLLYGIKISLEASVNLNTELASQRRTDFEEVLSTQLAELVGLHESIQRLTVEAQLDNSAKELSKLNEMSEFLQTTCVELALTLENARRSSLVVNFPLTVSPVHQQLLARLDLPPLTPAELTQECFKLDAELIRQQWLQVRKFFHSLQHHNHRQPLLWHLNPDSKSKLIGWLEMSLIVAKKYQTEQPALPASPLWASRVKTMFIHYGFTDEEIRDVLTNPSHLLKPTRTAVNQALLNAYFDNIWPTLPEVPYEPIPWAVKLS